MRKDDPDMVFWRAFSVCLSRSARVLVGSGASPETVEVGGSEGGMIALSIPGEVAEAVFEE